jgi:hypothetical protein
MREAEIFEKKPKERKKKMTSMKKDAAWGKEKREKREKRERERKSDKRARYR